MLVFVMQLYVLIFYCLGMVQEYSGDRCRCMFRNYLVLIYDWLANVQKQSILMSDWLMFQNYSVLISGWPLHSTYRLEKYSDFLPDWLAHV
jgi:hypothetical protein